MQTILNQIKRYNGQELGEGDGFNITLTPNNYSNELDEQIHTEQSKMQINGNYKVTVKKYMTEPSSTSFDFQDKWNNGVPMPMRIMQGKVIKETRGMVYMELQCEAKPSIHCFCCGKKLTNPISKLYGIGPECSAKMGIIRVETEDEVKEKWNVLEKEISNIKWSGYIIKSAITEWEEV